jgi:DNA polymerase-3 subunit beta
MNFTTNCKTLLSALQLCGKAVSQNNIIPASSCFRFQISDILKISSCNLEVSMETQIPATGDICDILIPADKIVTLLSKLPNQELSFIVDEKFEITITALSGKYSLSGYDGKDFPVIKTDKGISVIIDSQDLTAAICATSYARGTNEAMPAFTGLQVEFTADKMVINACNLSLLSVHNLNVKSKEAKFLMPNSITNIIGGIALAGDCNFTYSKQNISFEYSNLTIKSRLMDGLQPDWRSVIPDNKVLITANRIELLSSIKRVLDFSHKESKKIKLRTINGILTIEGEDTDYNQSAIENIKVLQPDAIEISINGQFIAESLAHFSSEMIEFYWQAPNKGIIINEPGDRDNFVLTMALV